VVKCGEKLSSAPATLRQENPRMRMRRSSDGLDLTAKGTENQLLIACKKEDERRALGISADSKLYAKGILVSHAAQLTNGGTLLDTGSAGQAAAFRALARSWVSAP
jgi:hypothetical protein